MATAATISARLVLDKTDYDKGLGDADKKANDFASKMGNVGKKMAVTGAAMTAGLTTPILAGLSQAVDAASSLGESVNKMNVVFGDSAKNVEEWSKTSAGAMGISQQAAVEAAATYGNLFTALGMGREPAAQMSTSLVQLASDLASFNNANPEDVLNALRSGLSGEVEPLKRFGIAMNEVTMKAKALQMGLGKGAVDMEKVAKLTRQMEEAQLKYNDSLAGTDPLVLERLKLSVEKAQKAYNEAIKGGKTESLAAREAALKLAEAQERLNTALSAGGENSKEAKRAAQDLADIQAKLNEAMEGGNVDLTEAEKLQVRYALIMDQTSNAQGDFARTSDGLANSMRITKAQFADTAAQLGQQLLPYVMKGMLLIQQLINWFTGLSGAQQKWVLIIAVVVAALGPLLTIIGTLVTIISAIGPVLAGVGPAMTAAGAAMAPFIAPILLIIGIIGLLYLAWTNNWGGIQEKTAAVWAWLEPVLASIWTWLQTNIPLAIAWLQTKWEEFLVAWNTGVEGWKNFGAGFQEKWNEGVAGWQSFFAGVGVKWEEFKASWEAGLEGWRNFGLGFQAKWDEGIAGWQAFFAGIGAKWDEFKAKWDAGVAGWKAFFDGFAALWDAGIAGWQRFFDAIAFGVKDTLGGVVDLFNRLKTVLSELQLPDWLTPGSPTPLELGLVGINKAMGQLASATLPSFSAGLELSPVGVDGGANFGAGGMNRPGAGNDNSQVVYWLQQIAGKHQVTAEEITRATRDADLRTAR